MDIQFENIYVDTEMLFRQTHQEHLKKKILIWSTIYIAVGVLTLYVGIAQDRPSYCWGSLLYFMLAVRCLRWPYRTARKMYNNLLKYYDGTIPETVVRFADTITLSQEETVTTIPYSKLKQVSLLKDCFLLIDEIGGFYIVSNEGFTKGTKQEMLVFLKEKCPQLKITGQ